MTIELTKNEAMWIADKAAAECARGESLLADVPADALKDESFKKLVCDLKDVVTALAKLGLKVITAIQEEEKAEEHKTEEEG